MSDLINLGPGEGGGHIGFEMPTNRGGGGGGGSGGGGGGSAAPPMMYPNPNAAAMVSSMVL